MRIIVISDSHGNYYALEDIVKKNLTADIFIHLGDGEREVEKISVQYPQLVFHHIKGNCDFSGIKSKNILCIELEYGHRLFAVHGHNHYVKSGLARLINSAVENNADIVLYGHTHERFCKYENGIYIMNPGSASCPRDGLPPSYGYIDVTEKGIFTNIVTLNRNFPS